MFCYAHSDITDVPKKCVNLWMEMESMKLANGYSRPGMVFFGRNHM